MENVSNACFLKKNKKLKKLAPTLRPFPGKDIVWVTSIMINVQQKNKQIKKKIKCRQLRDVELKMDNYSKWKTAYLAIRILLYK